eukprot:4066174-Amphidinium_carterae.1
MMLSASRVELIRSLITSCTILTAPADAVIASRKAWASSCSIPAGLSLANAGWARALVISASALRLVS